MTLRDLFIHTPDQDCTNPFALRHFVRFAFRLVVIALIGWWVNGMLSVSLASTPANQQLRIRWEKKTPPPATDYALVPPFRQTSGLPQGLIYSGTGDFVGTVFGYAPPAEIVGFPLLVSDFSKKEYTSPLTILLTLGSEPPWRFRYKTAIIDPVRKNLESMLLPQDVLAIIDISADGRYFAGLREIGLINRELLLDEFFSTSPRIEYGTEVVLIDAATLEWRGTGMQGPNGYFDNNGWLTVVGTRAVARYNPATMEVKRLEMPKGTELRASSDDRDDQLVGLSQDGKPWRSEIHRLSLAHDGTPQLHLIVSMNGWEALRLRKGMARLSPYPFAFQWVALDLEDRKVLSRDDTMMSLVAPIFRGLWLDYNRGLIKSAALSSRRLKAHSEAIKLEWAP